MMFFGSFVQLLALLIYAENHANDATHISINDFWWIFIIPPKVPWLTEKLSNKNKKMTVSHLYTLMPLLDVTQHLLMQNVKILSILISENISWKPLINRVNSLVLIHINATSLKLSFYDRLNVNYSQSENPSKQFTCQCYGCVMMILPEHAGFLSLCDSYFIFMS